MKTQKEFPTTAVLGLYVGRVLTEEGFGPIHAVADHLYPGIMTHSIPGLADSMCREVGRQYPTLARLPPCTEKNYVRWTKERIKEFGETMTVEGPIYFGR